MDRERLKQVLKVLVMSTLLPIVDVGTDLYTSISLFVGGHPIFASLVTILMWTPSILFFLNKKFLPTGNDSTEISIKSILLKTLVWPAYAISIIVNNFRLFITGVHKEFDENLEVGELKVAETGFESAPQAVLQLYIAFSLRIGDEGGGIFDSVMKGFSIAMGIFSLCSSSILINDTRQVVEGTNARKILRIIHIYSTIMASLILWSAMTFYLEYWSILAFIICYVTTYLFNAFYQKFGEEDSNEINWMGTPPFYWITAYIIGFCLPRREKVASIMASALTLGIFCLLIQKCVIKVDINKVIYQNSTQRYYACYDDSITEGTKSLGLWAPFIFVGLWMINDCCSLTASKGWEIFIPPVQIFFAFFLIIVIFVTI